MRSVAIASLLFVTVLAGCADDDEGSTALDLLSRAQAQAVALLPGARLVAAGMLETANTTAFEDEDGDIFLAAFAPNGGARVGDGRAEAWAYGFSDGNTSIAVVVSSNGTQVFGEDEAGFFFTDAIDLSLWRVDSDEAARIAARTDANYSRLASSPRAAGFAFLWQDEDTGSPFWVLGIEEDATDAEAWVYVNATDGNVLTEDEWELLLELDLEGEAGSWSGQVTLATTDDGEFAFNAPHESAAVALEVGTASPPFTTLRATVTAPDGTEYEVEASNGALGAEPVVLGIGPAESGAYDVSVEVLTGAVGSYVFSWCGGYAVSLTGFDLNPACEAIWEGEA